MRVLAALTLFAVIVATPHTTVPASASTPAVYELTRPNNNQTITAQGDIAALGVHNWWFNANGSLARLRITCANISKTATLYTGWTINTEVRINPVGCTGATTVGGQLKRDGSGQADWPTQLDFTNLNVETARVTLPHGEHTLTVRFGPAPAPAAADPSLDPDDLGVLSLVAGQAMTPTPTITAKDFSSAPSFTISPALPAGLSLNTSTGVISGTPTAFQSSTAHTITATAGSQTATAQVTVSVARSISPPSQTLTGVAGVAVSASQTLTAHGFTGTVSYTISPALPAGLEIDNSTGVISGTPTAFQSSTVHTITASATGSQTATAQVTVSVARSISPPSQTLTGVAGVAVSASQALTAHGFTGTVSYTISPALPTGLEIDNSTGVISGTPASAQLTTHTITGTAGSETATAEVTISVGASISPTSQTLTGVAGVAVSESVAFTELGFTGPVLYAISPALPTGLSIDGSTGIISGTSTVSHQETVHTVTATAGSETATAQVTISVAATMNPTSQTLTGVTGTALQPSSTFQTPGFTAPLAYSISPALPTGLTLNTSTGVISGTPESGVDGQTFTITAKGANPWEEATTTVTMTIDIAFFPGLTQVRFGPNYELEVDCGQAVGFNQHFVPFTGNERLLIRGLATCQSKVLNRYNTAIASDGGGTSVGTNSTGTWETFDTSSILGAGLYDTSDNAGGSLDRGSLYRNTIYTLSDPGGGTVEIIFYYARKNAATVSVNSPTAQTVSGLVGSPITPTVAYRVDGPAAPTFTVSPGLPAGLSIDPSTGVISGTPTSASLSTTYTVTASVDTGAATETASATVTIAVAQHRVRFTPQRGTVTTSVIDTATTGEQITLPARPTGVATHFIFEGWFDAATGGNRVGGAGGSFTPSSNTTIFGQWTEPFLVSFDRSGGGGPPISSIYADASGTVTLPSQAGQSALSFAGWFDAASGGTRIGGASDSYTPSSDLTLYAQWEARVSLFLQSGSLVAGTTGWAGNGRTVNVSTAPGIDLPEATRGGYRFDGWWTAQTGGTKVADAGPFTVTGNANLYARWVETRTVTFDPRSGAFQGSGCQPSGNCQVTVDSGGSVTLPEVTRTGLSFDGWFTSATGGSPVGLSGESITVSTNVTRTAQWSGTRTYDANGGSVSVSSVTAKADTQVSIPVPERPGFAFDKWEASSPTFGTWSPQRQTTGATMMRSETWTAQWVTTNAPVLDSAQLSDDRLTIVLTFSGDIQQLYGANANDFCREFRVQSTPKDANFDDATAHRECAITGSALEIRRTRAQDALQDSSKDLTVAYVGRSLAASADASEFVHQTNDIPVRLPDYVVTLTDEVTSEVVRVRPRSAVVFPATPTRPGFTFAGWFDQLVGGDRVDATAFIPVGHIELFARWAPIPAAAPPRQTPRMRSPELPVVIVPITPGPIPPRLPFTPDSAETAPGVTPGPGPQTPTPAPQTPGPPPRTADSGSVLQKTLEQPSGTIDVGKGVESFDGATQGTPGATRPTVEVPVRTPGEKRAEVLQGFAPASTTEIEVVGARTGARFVLSTQAASDKEQVAQAMAASTTSSSTDFFEVRSVQAVSAPEPKPSWDDAERNAVASLFESSGLPTPKSLNDFDLSGFTEWVKIESEAKTYVPGSTVYLTVTSEPIVIGQAKVNASGDAELVGTIPAELLSAGEHRIRLIGIRLLDGVSVDEDGNVQVSDATMAEIQRFDQGTQVTVAVLGQNPEGEQHTALRIVALPADARVSWWPLWLIVGAFGAFVLARTRGLLGQPIRRSIGLGVVGASALPAIVIGVASGVLALTWWGVAAGLLALGLAFFVPHRDPGAETA